MSSGRGQGEDESGREEGKGMGKGRWREMVKERKAVGKGEKGIFNVSLALLSLWVAGQTMVC